jgi:hypothetical protein
MHIIIETDLVEQYELEVRQILEILGHSDALVTDHSHLYDFTLDPSYGEDDDEIDSIREANAQFMEELGALCNGIVQEHDLVIDVAKWIRANM